MANSVGKLKLDFDIDLSKLKSALGSATSEARKAGTNVENSIKGGAKKGADAAKKPIDDLKKNLWGMVAGFGLYEALKKSFELMKKMAEFSFRFSKEEGTSGKIVNDAVKNLSTGMMVGKSQEQIRSWLQGALSTIYSETDKFRKEADMSKIGAWTRSDPGKLMDIFQNQRELFQGKSGNSFISDTMEKTLEKTRVIFEKFAISITPLVEKFIDIVDNIVKNGGLESLNNIFYKLIRALEFSYKYLKVILMELSYVAFALTTLKISKLFPAAHITGSPFGGAGMSISKALFSAVGSAFFTVVAAAIAIGFTQMIANWKTGGQNFISEFVKNSLSPVWTAFSFLSEMIIGFSNWIGSFFSDKPAELGSATQSKINSGQIIVKDGVNGEIINTKADKDRAAIKAAQELQMMRQNQQYGLRGAPIQ